MGDIAQNIDFNAYFAAYPWLPYAMMPFIIAFIGWFTNFLGIKMMFRPVEFVGIGPIGWQGIVPRSREKLTADIARVALQSMCTPKEMIEALTESDALKEISRLLEDDLEEFVDDFMRENGGFFWRRAPRSMRKPVYKAVRKQMPKMSRKLLNELKHHAERLIDIEEQVILASRKDPYILVHLMDTIYQREFRFIIMSGIYFGFPLGCLQALIMYFIAPGNWILPVVGGIAGGITNYLALLLLVHPVEPKKILGFTFHGQTLRRRGEQAGPFADIFMGSMMDSRAVYTELKEGKNKKEVKKLVRKTFQRIMDKSTLTQHLDETMRYVQDKDFDATTFELAERTLIDKTFDDEEIQAEIKKPVRDLLANRMATMPSEDYVSLFMPMFEQNKWLMISVGVGLGAAIGFLQLVYLFGDGLA